MQERRRVRRTWSRSEFDRVAGRQAHDGADEAPARRLGGQADETTGCSWVCGGGWG
jgi:hypothetical protein